MSTTLRTPESYLDEVAFENQFSNFTEVLLITNTPKQKSLILEAMRRMCEDAFKAQKEICADQAKTKLHYRYNGILCEPYIRVDKFSILNAPTPFDNQNKN